MTSIENDVPEAFKNEGTFRRLRDFVAEIACESRVPGSLHHANVRNAIRSELASLGFDAVEVPVACSGPPCINVLARWPRHDDRDRPGLVVGAHYDSMPDAPGADDNASAVAVLLEVARWIAPMLARDLPRYQIELAFYDREESGLVGSKAHARACAANGAPTVMIALEMLGFADHRRGSQAPIPGMQHYEMPSSANFLVVCADQGCAELAGRLAIAMSEPDGLPIVPVIGPDVTRSPWTRLSDHCSFWDEGLPAMVITDTGPLRNRHYHRPSDRPETLDYEFLAKGARGLQRAIDMLLFGR
jgi:hypothetical protein